jgi:iron-sulfur cluster assembly protein
MSETATLKKAPIKISDRAAKRDPQDHDDEGDSGRLRPARGVRGGGCSGMSYVLGFDKKRDFDVTYEIDGILTYIDKRHGLYLMGTVVDYHDGLNARGFTFENPNAVQTCGCGSSFSA